MTNRQLVYNRAAMVEIHPSIMSEKKLKESPNIFGNEKKKETRRHHVKQPRITAVIDELADELKKRKKKKK